MRVLPVFFLLTLVFAAGCGTTPESEHGGAGGTGGSGGSGGSGGVQTRTVEEVCRIWNEGHVENEEIPWVPGADTCDLGTLSEVAIEDGLRRINMFRALSDLPPVTENRELRTRSQACAVLMNVNDDLSHHPPETWTCWTEDAAASAASSNLSLGSRTPGNAIDQLMRDASVDSMGHRRWILGFFLGRTSIGFAGRATCVDVLDFTGETETPWTAYPPAGPAPIAMFADPLRRPIAWSFHPADGIDGAEVSMQRLPEGEEVPIQSWIPETGYMIPDAIVWQPPPVKAGESYRITITRPEKEPISYDVELVDCAVEEAKEDE